ncbi:hypothetical protein KA005_07500, partial [bacterium]|nr:hypothetical protein [bacterium]
MSQKNQFAVGGKCGNSFPKRNLGYLLFPFVLFTFCIMIKSPVLAQEPDSLKFTINLKSRKLMPQMGIKNNTFTKLKTNITQEKKVPHIIIQFKDTPSRKDRESLKMRGVKLLSYIGGNAWYASVSDTVALLFMDPRITAKYPTLGLIRWVGEILPPDKIDTKIAEVGIGSYAINPDGTVNIIVQFFKDVPEEQVLVILEKYGSGIRGPGMLNDWRVILNENDINKLVAEDEVQYIEEVSPPEKDHNDGSRNCANVNAVQAAPYNLDGDNVQVGEWDGGEIGAHTDLAGRLTIVETGTISDHATHVAGTLAGDGSESAGSGGTANQWRGVATEAELFSYTYLVDNLEPEDHNGAINDND